MNNHTIFALWWDSNITYYFSIPVNQFSRRIEFEMMMYDVLELMLNMGVISIDEKRYLREALDAVSVNVNEMWEERKK